MTARGMLGRPGLLVALAAGQTTTHADAAEVVRYRLDIASQPLLTALTALSDETGLEVMYFTEGADGVVSAPLYGEFTEGEALAIILRGTNLTSVVLPGQRAVATRPVDPEAEGSEGRDNPRHGPSGSDAPSDEAVAEESSPPEASRAGGAAGSQASQRLWEEIVVTANRRDESLLESASSLSAFGESLINDLGARSINDLLGHTPASSPTPPNCTATAMTSRFAACRDSR